MYFTTCPFPLTTNNNTERVAYIVFHFSPILLSWIENYRSFVPSPWTHSPWECCIANFQGRFLAPSHLTSPQQLTVLWYLLLTHSFLLLFEAYFPDHIFAHFSPLPIPYVLISLRAVRPAALLCLPLSGVTSFLPWQMAYPRAVLSFPPAYPDEEWPSQRSNCTHLKGKHILLNLQICSTSCVPRDTIARILGDPG